MWREGLNLPSIARGAVMGVGLRPGPARRSLAKGHGGSEGLALEVIAAGLGRNATLSVKFALEALGLGPCHHMTEVFADGRRQIPLWLEAAAGRPDWEAIFAGYRSTSDYPSASYWRELTDFYPAAKVVLTTRDPDRWFDSVSETIFSPAMRASHAGTPAASLMQATMFDPIAGDVTDRAFLTRWYSERNAAVIAGLPADRLLHFRPADGWAPLCAFLGVEEPDLPFPRVNSREQLGSLAANDSGAILSPESRERFGRQYIEVMRQQAFTPRS